MAQELYSKAALVNHEELARAQAQCELVKAESLMQDGFASDVRPAIQDWRMSKGLPPNLGKQGSIIEPNHSGRRSAQCMLTNRPSVPADCINGIL